MLATCIPLAACAETAPQYTSLQMDINWDHMKTIGKQNFNGEACACYALAYCRIMLDSKLYPWYEFSNSRDEFNCSAQWGDGDYSKYRNESKADTFKKLYNELCKGNPTVAQVKKIGKSNMHNVAVVGFTGVTDLDTLSEANFLILDPGTAGHKIFNMSEKYELRKNPEDFYYRLYTDTSSATVSYTSEPFVAVPEEPAVTEPPVVDDGKWPTPTDLRWGYLHDAILNENEVVEGWQFVSGRPTDIAFRSEADGWHSVTLYKENGDNDAYINSGYAYGYDGYYSDPFIAGVPDLETGDYYFTVYCAGSSGHEDSEIATSEILHYTRPTAKLATPTDLGWNGTVISYTIPGGTTFLGGYDLEWLYAETADEEPRNYGGAYNMLPEEGNFDLQYHCSSFSIDREPGYYYYKLRLLSSDATRTCHSEESVMSPALYFDGTNFEVRPGYTPGTTPEVPPVVEDGKLSTATDLKWGYTVEYINNDVKQVPGRTSDVSWNITPNNHGNMYSVEVFQEKGDNDVCVGNWGGSYSSNAAHQYGGDSFAVGTLELETGDYYYVVTNIDTTGAKDLSDPAVSGLWHYTKPDLRVGICTDLTWDWPYANFAAPAGDPNVDGYTMEWYYSETEGGELKFVTTMYTYSPDFTSCDLIQHMTSRFGNGYYYFKVKALSRDISIACNSNWSELSGACYFDGTTGTPVAPEAPHTHTFGDWFVTTAATCTAEGSRTRSCECGETETETIPAVGHTEVVDAAVAATCTADGKTEGKHCSVCAQVLTAQEAIPATGHDTQGGTEFVWSEDHSACTLEVGCTACGQKQSVACTVTSEVVNGTIVYRASVDFNGMSFSDAQQGGAAEAPAAWGDVSGDGWVDSFDASLIMKYDVMLIGDNDLNLAAADVSGDGYVDSYDASLILKFDVMLIEKFPVEG